MSSAGAYIRSSETGCGQARSGRAEPRHGRGLHVAVCNESAALRPELQGWQVGRHHSPVSVRRGLLGRQRRHVTCPGKRVSAVVYPQADLLYRHFKLFYF